MHHTEDDLYPRHCEVCTGTVTLSDRLDFTQHLRRMHSTKEGGSYICRYGPNGVCQTLPLEGVSDCDYEAHIRKCHANTAPVERRSPSVVNSNKSTATKGRKGSDFTVHSFTQNLSAVLLNPKRSRSEIQVFFTRHWGDSFTPQKRVLPAPSLPIITPTHFKKYLETTAKKHRHCLRAKRELRWALARHQDDTRIDASDVPHILLDPHFSLADSETFDAVFLESVSGQPDLLHVDGKPYTQFVELQRRDSGTSLAPSVSDDGRSLQMHESFEAGQGRHFRPYDTLQNCLEFYHDLVDSRLNNQLASKSNEFWKTVISCGSLSEELADAKEKVAMVRQCLKRVDEKIYQRMIKTVELYKRRQQQEKILHKLQDMACLRDAQITVQMLLNQNDFPKALECIQTAQDVLNNELRGVTSFRHLGPQLQELQKVIAKMLYEEFVALIQKELGRPCETESEAIYQGGHLSPIMMGLMRVKEYRFVQVMQQEIIEALKNAMRQIMKAHVVKHVGALDLPLGEFDPSLGNLSTQMRRLDFKEWYAALSHILNALYLLCRRVQSIQEVILDIVEVYVSTGASCPAQVDEQQSATADERQTERKGEYDQMDDLDEQTGIFSREALPECEVAISGTQKEAEEQSKDVYENGDEARNHLAEISCLENSNGTTTTASLVGTASTPAALLSMPCRTAAQVGQSVELLTAHAAYAAQERSCRLLVARSKDGFLEKLSVSQFHSVITAVQENVQRCRTLIGNKEKFASPLWSCVVQQCSCFIKKFHEDRKTKIGNILDSENWRATEVPEHFQRLVDKSLEINRFTDVTQLENHVPPPKPNLVCDGEPYVVVGTALILLQMMAQYCDLLEVLPDHAPELLMCVVELLKNYNSRSCQLILGAGALQLIGLKSISVRHLALSSRCLQLILKFIPYLKTAFEQRLPDDKKFQLRHLTQVVRDYNDHIQEIVSKLISVIDHHLVTQLQMWEVKGSIPSPTFQQMCKQIGKFYNGLTGIMPESLIEELFLRVHENFKRNLKSQLEHVGITPHDSLTYGLVSQEYSFYIKSLQALPCCSNMKNETISEALFSKG